MSVLCIITDGFEELEAIGVIALLRRANIKVDVYTLDNDKASGRFHVTIDNLRSLDDCDFTTYDMLCLPGGPHYKTLAKDTRVLRILHYFAKEHKLISAICAAPTILGHEGLLKGKNYTCFTSMNEDFGGTYIDSYTVVDNNLITGRSAAAVIDFAFAIIEKLKGIEAAEATKREIYYER